MFRTLVHALPLEQLVCLKLHGVALPVSFTAIPPVTNGGHHAAENSATQPGDQLEDDYSSEESDEDNRDGDEGDESFELSFTISILYEVFFNESVCSDLTMKFFDKLTAL